jgi:hypothetical protein
MPHSIPVGRHTRRAAWLMTLGMLALTISACQDVAGPESLVSEQPEALPWQAASTNVPGQYIVTFSDDVSDVPGFAKQLVAQSGGSLNFTYTKGMRGFSATMSPQAAAALFNNPNVDLIEPVQTVAAAGVQSPAPWWLDRIDQRTATLDNAYNWPSSGAGVTVYILDSGIRITHQDFEGRASYGYDFVSNTTTASDCNGHGTHIAGSVGGRLYGVAKGASLVSVRVLDCNGAGTTSNIIAALDWVARNHVSPAIANLSLSGPYSATLNQAIANTIASGVTVTVAAGDGGATGYDACQYSPASAAGAITTGAMSTQMGLDAQGSYSNAGPCVDLFAPGYQITSDWYTSDAANWLLTGTSPSSALVAGASALYLAANPSATPSQVAAGVVAASTTNVLAGLGAGSPNRLLYTGTGTTPVPPNDPPPPPPPGNAAPVANFIVTCAKASCSFDASSSTDDAGISTYAWLFGDGTSASGSSALSSHVYGLKGNYNMTVTLTVTDGGGLASSVQKTVTIRNKGK